MRGLDEFPPTELQARATGSPPILVLLLDLGQAISNRLGDGLRRDV
jgi:hypothetical protein